MNHFMHEIRIFRVQDKQIGNFNRVTRVPFNMLIVNYNTW